MAKNSCDLILKVSCPDSPGLVSKIANYIASYNANVIEFNQFADSVNDKFFARLEIDTSESTVEVEDLESGFAVLGKSIGAKWHFRRLPHKTKTALLVTKTTHCLNEILWRAQVGELPVEITSVIGNREHCREDVERAGLKFHFVDFEKQSKDEAFKEVGEILSQEEVNLVVLARFMQIMPAWLCEEYSGRMINIHHSFLPAFIGANPYRQAYNRGVKLIGATCHYVTSDLDAGPIIEQQVSRVHHFHSVHDLTRMGRDCERAAIAKGIRYHVYDRTIIDGNRAIVFSD